MKKINSLITFLKTSLLFDLVHLRSRFFIFLFNLVPDLMVLSPVRNSLLRLGGMKLPIWNAYIRSPFHCYQLRNVTIAEGVFINKNAYIDGGDKIVIGKNCQIGPYLKIENVNHDTNAQMTAESKPVTISDNVWIASNVLILPGISITSHCTIAGGAVVTKSINIAGSYGGVPAKPLVKKPL